MGSFHSISDVFSVPLANLSYNLSIRVQYWSRVVSVRPFLSSSNVYFVSVINTEQKKIGITMRQEETIDHKNEIHTERVKS